MTHAISGEKTKAKGIIDRFNNMAKSRYVPQAPKALIYIGLDQLDKALELLEMACEQRDPLLLWLKSAPHFDQICSDPGFKRFLKKIGFD